MLDACAGLLTSARSRSALEEPAKMDLHALISVLSVMHCWMFCTVLSAPATVTPSVPSVSTRAPERHVRTKRCSCATFMDKECVYFCHLDIIWVNTPERVVSYGLGNAPRTRRALSDSMVTGAGPRCACLRENDAACRNFCRPRSDTVIRSAEGDGCAGAKCGPGLAADASATRRAKSASVGRVSPGALRAALKTRLLLEKWRVRRRHRARAWEGESAAS